MKKLLVLLAIFIFVVPVSIAAAKDVILQWDPNIETDLAWYRMYRSTVSGQYSSGNQVGTDIAAGTQTFTDTGIPDGTYYWVVRAVDTEQNESGNSNEVTKNIDTSPPANPLGLKIVP